MKLDELAFFNQQLASMLKSGLPLEGSLRQLAAGMGRGKFRDAITALESKLAAGVPLEKAVAESALPDFYQRMLIAGRASESLPQVLLLLADYYQQASVLATRVKGVLFYPGIVIIGSWLLSLLIWFLYGALRGHLDTLFAAGWLVSEHPTGFVFGMILPSLVITFAAVVYLIVIATPALRRLLMWKLPGLKEASVARLAHLFGLMLASGCSLKETLPVLSRLERGTEVQRMIHGWEQAVARGANRFEGLEPTKNSPLPPLFFWLVGTDRENWAAGLLRAAAVYHNRAHNKLELILAAALPVCVVFLGVLILYQTYSLYVSLLTGFIDYLGGAGDMLF